MSSLQATERIAPLRAPFQANIQALLAKWMPPGAQVQPLGLFRTLARHEELAGRMRPLGAGILAHGQLDARDREIVIARTCARAGAEYEWGVHVLAYGKPLGLSDAQIAATVHGSSEDPLWSERDSLLIAMADELHERCTISETLWAGLAECFSDEQLLELLITSGWYRLLSYVINAAGVQLEPWAARFPAEASKEAG
ncbi:MAG TPA: carboxymuconolactone decarboxylase family protein [Solirubrobacteraceae bacterium]